MSEISINLWANQFAQSIANQNTENCIDFFDSEKIMILQINQLAGLSGDGIPQPI